MTIPQEILALLPIEIVGPILFLIVVVWLFGAVKGIITNIASWRKDEGESAVRLHVEREKELREAINAAREARLAESRWYGQWVEAKEELRKMSYVAAALGRTKDTLEKECAEIGIKARLYEAFLDSDIYVSHDTKVAWDSFRKTSKAVKIRTRQREPEEDEIPNDQL